MESINKCNEGCYKEIYERELKKIAEYSEKFIQAHEFGLDYREITDDFREMCEAKFAAFNLYDDDGEYFNTVAISGDHGSIDKVSNLLGMKFAGKTWPHDLEKAEKIKDKTTTHFASLEDLAGTVLPKGVLKVVAKTFELGEAVVIKITKKGQMIGDFILIMPKGKSFTKTNLAEIFSNQLGLAIERQKTEAQLAESQERMELFFQQSLSGFFFMMLDEPIEWNDKIDKESALDYVFAHQRITKANQAMLNQYRLKENEFLGLTPNDMFAHDLEQGREVWRKFFDQGKLHIDTDEQRADGTQVWIEGDYICLYDDAGRIIGHFGNQQDITARKQAELQLEQRHHLLSTLSQQVPGAIYQYLMKPDGSSCFFFASDGIWDVYEVTPDEVQDDANKVFLRIHPEDYDRVVTSMQQSAKELSIMDIEYRVHLPEKGQRWLRGIARPNKLTDGSVLWHGYLRDITEDKKMEEALRKSEESFRSMFKKHESVMLLVDPNTGKIIDANSAAEKFYGFILGQHKQLTIQDINIASKEEILRSRQEALEGKRNYFIFRHKVASGEIRDVEVYSTPIEVRDQKLLFSIIHDITERKKMEQALQRLKEEKAITRFV